MTNIERHQHILKQISEEGKVSVLELCERLDVSSVTIRKDLQILEDRKLVYRTHGGATKANPYTADRNVLEKVKIHAAEKRLIAKAAASMIEENDSIIIASGTTVQAMAEEITPKGHLTVVTSAINVAVQLIHHPNTDIIQLGGALRKTSSSVAGSYAESALADFFCSKCFLGVDGIDIEYGITTTNVQEAHLNRKMIMASQKTIVLVDSSKFGKKGFGRIASIEEIEVVITDNGIPEKTKEDLMRHGVQVVVV